jgi:ABC-2 type transport system ATP-binding protein
LATETQPSMAAAPMIATHGLSRDFKKTQAVVDLDLTIQPGELFGLVGPDGAGKTTTLRLLAGLLDITDGEATVAGYDLKTQSEDAKPHVGYMAQQFSLYAELSVLENLRFFAELFDVPRADLAQRTDRLLDFAGLSDFKDRRAAHLSGGMQKKLALACTLVHQPEILLLDEPTTGVDPISRREFWDILTELHIQGVTILVSTPYMDEADRCSRVGLMFAGRLVRCDTPRRIRETLEGEMIEVQAADWQAAHKRIDGLPGVREVQTYGESLHILVDDGQKRLPEIERALHEANIDLRSIRVAPARMEEAFISLIRKMEAG